MLSRTGEGSHKPSAHSSRSVIAFLIRTTHSGILHGICRGGKGSQRRATNCTLRCRRMPGNGGTNEAHLFSTYGVPLAVTATTVLGVLSYQIYRWYLVRSDRNDRAKRLLERAKSSPGELPLSRPITMGGEAEFREYIRASKLPKGVRH